MHCLLCKSFISFYLNVRYIKFGNMETAKSIFTQMKQNMKDVKTYTIMIGAYGNFGMTIKYCSLLLQVMDNKHALCFSI